MMNTSKAPLKILHILDHSLPVHSGYAFRSQAIFQAQKKQGWNPIVLTSPKHYESWSQKWTESEEINGVCYNRTEGVPKGPTLLKTELQIMAILGRRIESVVQREKPSLLHVHSPILNAVPALWVGYKAGIPVVYEMRSLWEDAAVDHGTYGPHSWRYKLVKSIETWVCHRAAHVAVLCNGLLQDLIERGVATEKLTVIPNGVDVNAFRAGEPDLEFLTYWNLVGKKVVGFLGSFFRYEGLDLLVEAFARLARVRSDVALLLVGGGEMDIVLKEQIKRLGIENSVVILDQIAHDRIPSVYASIDILAYPRYSMRLTELVTPLKPLEAMAMGKVVIASDVGGHRELIRHGHTGFLFTAGDISAFIAGLEQLFDDADLRRTLAIQGATWVRQERSWERTTAGYSGIYAKVLGESCYP